MIPWYIWVVLGLIVLSSLASVASVGKPRAPLTGGAAVIIIIVNALIAWAIIEGVTR